MAFISELHYSNSYASNSSTEEFVEVVLEAGENPADFVVSFYQQNGTTNLQITLNDPLIEVFTLPNGRTVYVLDAVALNFKITGPTSSANRNYEGIALTDTSGPTNSVVDFYTMGSGGTITATNGLAAGVTSTNLTTNASNTSLQIDGQGNVTQAAHTRGAVPCFVAGCRLMTSEGLRPVENILPGDQVLTMDRGFRTVTWSGRRSVKATGRFAPVVIRKGTLGAQRDLWLSPQHRVLLTGWEAEIYFGREEVLVPAIALVNDYTILRCRRPDVTYVHLMFDHHEIVETEGVLTESFFPGEQILSTLDQTTLNELLKIFPELCENPTVYGTTARQVIRGSEARVLGLP